jgi:hypothetical protein
MNSITYVYMQEYRELVNNIPENEWNNKNVEEQRFYEYLRKTAYERIGNPDNKMKQ